MLTKYLAYFLIIISCLASYIKEEHGKKLDAQVLYDELRISEEQLKQAKRRIRTLRFFDGRTCRL